MVFVGENLWPKEIIGDLEIYQYDSEIRKVYADRHANLYESLLHGVRKNPEKTALIEKEKQITYKHFITLVEHLAGALEKRCGIRQGDRIALLMVNSIDFCASFYAVTRLGAVAIPLSTKLKSGELKFPLEDSGAKALILNGRWWANIAPILNKTSIENCIVVSEYSPKMSPAIALDVLLKDSTPINQALPTELDPATIIYTSGTTGLPKGAVLTHQNFIHSIITYERILGLTSQDSTIIAVPIFHITGLAALMGLFLYIGGTAYLQPYFNAHQVLATMAKTKITFFHASPTIYIMLLAEKNSFTYLPYWRQAACGSGAIPQEVLAKIKEWVPQLEFRTIYGLTETSSPATIFPGDASQTSRIPSSGLPVPGITCKVVNDQGADLPPLQPGELLIKGTLLTNSYWHNEEATRTFIRNGWLKTGDIAQFDADGYLYILDRLKDMINRGGEKIFSLEVENVLYNHPGVKEVAVVGVADPLYGEVPKAFIVPQPGIKVTVDELKKWVAEHLAKYKVPHDVEFVRDLPRTDNGKIAKKALRQ